MALSHSPKIVTDGLVLCLDAGDGKSYKGEPTTNYGPASFGDWGTESTAERIATGNTYLGQPTYNCRTVVGQSYRGIEKTVTGLRTAAGSSGTVTMSCMVRNNNSSAYNMFAYIGHDFGSTRSIAANSDWQKVQWTVNQSSMNNDYVEFRPYTNNASIYLEMTMPMVEVNKGHATQFVNGTRSATQGLIDRTGTSTIDISNASFDSNAQMEFDGTDDYANVDHQSSYDTNVFTIESWFKSTADDNTHDSIVTRNGDVYSSTNGWSLGKLRNGLGDTQNALRWIVWGTSAYTDLLGDSATTGNWIHAVGVSDGSTLYLYQNGVLKTSSSKPAGNIYPASYGLKVGANKSSSDVWNGHIDSVKMYNKALTASEVLQNYNATKGRFGL